MVVLKFLYNLWKKDDKKSTSSSYAKTSADKKAKVQKYTRDAIKNYEKTLRRLAHE